MKVNIISKEQNPLMKRKEITFSVDHAQTGGTPSRVEVRRQLASLLQTKPELVFVNGLKTKTGTMVAVGDANVYESVEQAKLMEPKHVIARNVLPEKKTEEPQKSEEATEKKEE
ncbi:MAG: 30S ribosomal protein S24e [Candidatus Bathyarchaeum sp.]|nr:MAG: 30S ribosomal protein S24e [Candidatus Bathyarchaeum sp.]